MAGLTSRMNAFVEQYISTGSALQAARLAGYSEKGIEANSSRLMADDRIQARIRERQAERQAHDENTKKAIADADEVLAFLTSVMRGEVLDEIPLFKDKGLQELAKAQPSAQTKNRAAELLGKRYLLFTDKTQVEGQVSLQWVEDIPQDKGSE